MIRPDGSLTIAGRVVLKHHNRDLFVIERTRLNRVFIEGEKVCWILQGEDAMFECHVGSDWSPKIFDAIVFESKDIIFVEEVDDDTGRTTGWTRLTHHNAGGIHPGNNRE